MRKTEDHIIDEKDIASFTWVDESDIYIEKE